MKYLSLVLSIALMSCSLTSNDKVCKISGTAKDDVKIFFQMSELSDSVQVVDGKFEIEIPVDSVTLRFLSVEGNKNIWPTIVYLEPGQFEMNFMSEKNFHSIHTIDFKGSSYNELNKKYCSVALDLEGSINEIERQKLKKQLEILKQYPNHKVSITTINSKVLTRSGYGNEDILEQIYDYATEQNPDKDFSNLKVLLDATKERSNGKFPDLKINNTNGEQVPVYKNLGKYTLIDLWASWCRPCRKEIPYVKEAFEKYGNKGLKVIAISVDKDKDKWQKAIGEENISQFINLNKPDILKNELSKYYVDGIPDNFLLDQNGNIVGNTLRGDDLMQKLNEVFSK